MSYGISIIIHNSAGTASILLLRQRQHAERSNTVPPTIVRDAVSILRRNLFLGIPTVLALVVVAVYSQRFWPESPLVAKFEQIQEGMTYDQAVKVLGLPNGPGCAGCATCWPDQTWWDDGRKMIVVKHERESSWRVTSKELVDSVDRESWFLSCLEWLRKRLR
jgi:hypothetical protein